MPLGSSKRLYWRLQQAMGSLKRFLWVQKEESSSEQAVPVEGLVTSGLKPYGPTPQKRASPFRGTFSLESHWGPGDHFPLLSIKSLNW